MGKHHAPRPRGFDPGGFRFPGSTLWLPDRNDFDNANDLAAPRQGAPAEARVEDRQRSRVVRQRRHGVFRRSWMYGLLRAAAALLAVACASPPAQDPVVVILRDGLPACSAVAIGPHELVTVAHCVGELPSVSYVTADKWQNTARGFDVARVERVDEGGRLAFLRAPTTFATPARPRAPRAAGEPGLARSPLFELTSFGKVLPGIGSLRDSTLTAAPGWSGSPVFGNDNRLIGLVRSCLGGVRDNRKFCLPQHTVIATVPGADK